MLCSIYVASIVNSAAKVNMEKPIALAMEFNLI